MKITNTLMAGSILLALWSCDDSSSSPNAAPWPPASDGFKWPATDSHALVFETLANADVDEDVLKAAETLKSRYSPDDVTFARSDFNADGRAEILIKAHHYGFAPSYAILTQNDSGDYSDIGWISGDQISRCDGIDGWQPIQTLSANDQIRQLYSYREGIYDLTRYERLVAQTNTVTILSPTKAEQDGGGQPATRHEFK